VIGLPINVILTVGAVNLIYQFWVHTQFIGRLGVLDHILVTPSNHRVHHAQNEIYIDKNYGGILILWDRLFGTFQEELDAEPVVFGVRKPLANWNPFWANLQVYGYLWFDAVHAASWKDKIAIWFRRTGWRPADVALRYPKQVTDLETFSKFDPKVGDSRRRYVTGQFIVVVATALWIANRYAAGGPSNIIVPCLLLWTQLYVLGLLSEGRNYAGRFELTRLLVIVPLGILALQAGETVAPMSNFSWSLALVYIAGSCLWLKKSASRLS
jgi:hypothetical protein